MMNCIRRLVWLIIPAVFLLVSCSELPGMSPPAPKLSAEETGYPHWNDRVYYEIFVRSFQDSDGDGIGDFNGLTNRLDYLNDGDPETDSDLGITGIWLMPVHPATSYHGYDVIDYYTVSPELGTLKEFKQFLSEAHQRGIHVIIDLVINHTSNQHPWFQAAQNPASPYRDWYVWSDTRPNEQTWHAGQVGYYYGFFWSGMPDLNYSNSAVGMEMQKIASFWLEEIGVDGFRIDAAKYLIEDDTNSQNSPATHAWYRAFRQYYKAINPQALTVGEVWDTTPLAADYSQGDELDLTFDFGLAQALIVAARASRAEPVYQAMQEAGRVFKPLQYATFIANHDQNRVMSQLARDERKANLAAKMLLTLPGVPFLYYGEEIGMQGVKPDEQIRTPMQWTPGTQAGFTTGQAWISIPGNYEQGFNVEQQAGKPDSLSTLYRDLIHLRSGQPALRLGSYLPVVASDPAVFAFLRTSNVQTVLVLINLGQEPLGDIKLNLAESQLSGELNARPLWGKAKVAPPQLTPSGGFSQYTPLSILPAGEMCVIQLYP